MKAFILKAFPDSYRQSMKLYAECLQKTLQPILESGEQTGLYEPKRVFLSPFPLRWWSQYADYPAQCSSLKADIFHITDHVYSHLVRHLDPRKTIVTFHDAVGFNSKSVERRGFLKGCARQWNLKGLAKAARIICVSEMSKRKLLQLMDYPLERIRVIHLGIENTFFEQFSKQESLRRLGIPSGPFYILHTGHTKDHKNIPALFHVVSILKGKIPRPFKILKTGMPFSSEQNLLAQKLGVAGDIRHLGLLDKDRIPDAYRCADVLLLPSYDEGFGFPLLEAMSSSLPIVASNRGSIPEVAGDAALLTEPDNYDEMAGKILSIALNPEVKEALVRKGHEWVRQFRWEETARKTLSVYREIYNSNQSTRK